jgi:chromosomal replication initiation ATPase DnaA
VTQLAIHLPFQPALGAVDFLTSECNRAAVDRIERWPDWPGRVLALHGPEQCGKTHLARLWSVRSGGGLVNGPALNALSALELAALPGVAIDDADAASERALLHLHNCCRETGSGLLIVAREPPSRWSIALPDLASRLRAMPLAGIEPPDDVLLAGLLVKHFADRQIRVAPSVICFAVRRIERSFAAAAAFVEAVDQAALAVGGSIGIALVRRVLGDIAAQPAARSDFGVT